MVVAGSLAMTVVSFLVSGADGPAGSELVADAGAERPGDRDPGAADGGPVEVDAAVAAGPAVPVVGVAVADVEGQVDEGGDDDRECHGAYLRYGMGGMAGRWQVNRRR